jgi:hypothetical protein
MTGDRPLLIAGRPIEVVELVRDAGHNAARVRVITFRYLDTGNTETVSAARFGRLVHRTEPPEGAE